MQLQKWDCTKGGHERDEQDEDILISRSVQYAAVGAAVVKIRGESMDFQHATTQGQ